MLAAERYDGAEPVNLGAGLEITIRELVEHDREVDGFRRRDPLGRHQARRPAAARARHQPGARALRVCAHHEFEDGIRRTIEWYRSTRSSDQTSKAGDSLDG